MRPSSHDLPRTVLAVLFLGLLLVGVFRVVQPFLAALVWAATIAVATWPIREALVRRLGGRKKLAVTLLVVALLLLFVLPFFSAIVAIVSHVDDVTAAIQGYFAHGLPAAPAWLARLPLVGGRAAEAWNRFTGSALGELAGRLTPYLGNIAGWFAARVGGIGRLFVQFLMTVAISGVLWSSGEAWAAGLRRFARRLGGDDAEKIVLLAGGAVRSVALGVVVTAVAQTALAGLGLAIAGIPFALPLTVVIFLLCIAQLGPLPVLLPAVAWLFSRDETGWGVFLLVCALVVGTMDNFLRPMLIRRGADMPLLLVFAGVIGGLVSFGLVGLFIGPVILVVAHTLLAAWLAAEPAQAASPSTAD
jgi:predicted PurR-regulated permease PerM